MTDHPNDAARPAPAEPEVTTDALGEEDPGSRAGEAAPAEPTTDALSEEDPAEPAPGTGVFGDF